jgi:hypothetical protein
MNAPAIDEQKEPSTTAQKVPSRGGLSQRLYSRSFSIVHATHAVATIVSFVQELSGKYLFAKVLHFALAFRLLVRFFKRRRRWLFVLVQIVRVRISSFWNRQFLRRCNL